MTSRRIPSFRQGGGGLAQKKEKSMTPNKSDRTLSKLSSQVDVSPQPRRSQMDNQSLDIQRSREVILEEEIEASRQIPLKTSNDTTEQASLQ